MMAWRLGSALEVGASTWRGAAKAGARGFRTRSFPEPRQGILLRSQCKGRFCLAAFPGIRLLGTMQPARTTAVEGEEVPPVRKLQKQVTTDTKLQYTLDDVKSWLESELASDIVIMDTLGDSSVGDWLVFCTAQSRAHMQRLATAVTYEMKHRGVLLRGEAPTMEGSESDDWVLVDGGHVIVNVMLQKARWELDLEGIWEGNGAVIHWRSEDHGADIGSLDVAGDAADDDTEHAEPAAGAHASSGAGVYEEVDDFELLQEAQSSARDTGDDAENDADAEYEEYLDDVDGASLTGSESKSPTQRPAGASAEPQKRR
eukprot:6201641-Pleurochrysis_carterae.AAC.2